VSKLIAALVLCAVLVGGLAFVEVPGFGSPWQWMTTQPFTKERVEESKAIAGGIIQALERRRAAEGAYPDDLSDLVPRYLERIPLPTAGCREWEYRLEEKGFVLRFYRPGGYPKAWYRSSRGAWAIDD
jgi:hypothetical protein